jgi:hypothetical protein
VAQYDSADLLARVKRLAKRPGIDEDTTDAEWYVRLEEAQTKWMAQFAALVPEQNYAAPELLTTADAGLTYQLGTEPLGGHIEIRHGRDGQLLIPSTDWGTGDFVFEGQTIRMPHGRARTFDQGLYARYVKAPGLLTAGVQPVLKPAWCRLILPPTACYLHALEGGLRDPNFYLKLMQDRWAGDPDLAGDTGMLGTLKTQYFAAGMASVATLDMPWWRNNPDLSGGA